MGAVLSVNAICCLCATKEELVLRGNAHFGGGKFASAIEAYEYALRSDPDMVDAHSNIANSLAHLQRMPEAVAAYARVCKLAPGVAEHHADWASAVAAAGAAEGGLPAAIVGYHRALQLDPAHERSQFNLGNAHLVQGDMEQAVAAYQRAAALETDPARRHRAGGPGRMLATALQRGQRFQEAAEAWEQVKDTLTAL